MNTVPSYIQMLILILAITALASTYTIAAEFDETVNMIQCVDYEFCAWYHSTTGTDTFGYTANTTDNGPTFGGTRCAQFAVTDSITPMDLRSHSLSPAPEPQKKYRFQFDYKTLSGSSGNFYVHWRFYDKDLNFLGQNAYLFGTTDGNWQRAEFIGTVPAVASELLPLISDVRPVFNQAGSTFSGTIRLDNFVMNPGIAPNEPDEPFPTDGSKGWSDEITLKWAPDSNASAYLVYLGTSFNEVNLPNPAFLIGDLDFDGIVGLRDLSILAGQWLKGEPNFPGPVADIRDNNNVDLADYADLAINYKNSISLPSCYKGPVYSPEFKPDLLGDNQDYYWRVDKVLNGQVQKGQIWSFNCEDYLDYNISAPQHIYYIEKSYLTNTQQVMFQTLQGLVARNRPQLFIRTNSNGLWLNDLASRYGIGNTNIASIDGPAGPVAWALDNYSNYYDSYILCDAYNDPDSLTAAICLASALPSSIVVHVTDQSLMTSRNVPLSYDARGHDEKWVWDQFSEAYTKKAIFVQRNDITIHGAFLRDLPVTLGALTWWHPNLNYTEEVFSQYRANIPCFGWDSAVAPGEGNAIAYHSEHNMYTAVTDWMLDLSLYAGMASIEPEIEFTQPCSDNTYTPEDNVHYVAFCMSDMDNTNTVFSADGWAQNSLRYGNSHRGEFAMGWGMPPIMMKIGPTIMKWWYDNAYETDCFIGYCSGLDYFNPSKFPELELHMSHLDKYLRKADLSTMCILDNFSGTLNSETYEVGHLYGQLESLRGFFLGYDKYNGAIHWFNGKPMVTGRYALWKDRRVGICNNGVNLAASINALPANPYIENGYTFVIVHAWSYGWDEVATCIDNLDSNVRVVTPNELIEQIYLHNLGPN